MLPKIRYNFGQVPHLKVYIDRCSILRWIDNQNVPRIYKCCLSLRAGALELEVGYSCYQLGRPDFSVANNKV